MSVETVAPPTLPEAQVTDIILIVPESSMGVNFSMRPYRSLSRTCDKLPDRGHLREREGLFCPSVSKKRLRSGAAGTVR